MSSENAFSKDVDIKPLSDEMAFQKGAEYFVEYVFFYGLLLSISIYEARKKVLASNQQKATLDKLTKYC